MGVDGEIFKVNMHCAVLHIITDTFSEILIITGSLPDRGFLCCPQNAERVESYFS